jgi:tetratricopeptide (TPR) repeat protein
MSKDNTNKVDPDAIALIKELDGLPLALSTAGAYLEHVTTSFSDYLQLYRASWLQLQTTSPLLNSYEDRTLHTTWQITFDRIQRQNTASAKLLKLWAYFDRQDLWFDLLRHADSADESIQKLGEGELNFNEAVRLLCSFGLVDLDRSQQQFGSGGYSVHSCVHSWTVFVLNKEWDTRLAQLALTCVASEIPMRNERNSWILQRRLLQHAIRQERFILEGKVDWKEMKWAVHKLGLLYVDQGKLAEAEAMYTRALQGYEEALGPKHTSTLGTVHNLGSLYKNQGKLAKAEAMYTRALQGYEEALGPKHTSTLDTVNNLGLLYKNQGKLAQAEAMYTRALQGYEEALGPENLRSYLPALNTMFGFGDLFARTGRKDMAKEMYSRALSGYTTVQGPSSKWCRELEDRLQALQVASIESEVCQDEFTEMGALKPISLKQKLRKLGRRLSVR